MILKYIPIGLILSSIISFSTYATPFKYDYKLHGKVVGMVAVESNVNSCYIAVQDSSDPGHSNHYHSLNNRSLCAMTRLAYLTGDEVYLYGKGVSGNNDTVAIELSGSSHPIWWN